ncbi:hypothetical protein BH10CYA1_BH10CYA1_52850 [soil metagenome]
MDKDKMSPKMSRFRNHFEIRSSRRHVCAGGLRPLSWLTTVKRCLTAGVDWKEAANRFAMELLIPPVELTKFLHNNVFTQEAIRQFAKKSGIAPGILVGRLQFEGKLEWNQFRSLKKNFSWDTCPT